MFLAFGPGMFERRLLKSIMELVIPLFGAAIEIHPVKPTCMMAGIFQYACLLYEWVLVKDNSAC
jgi:hypothetical protein